MTRTRMLRPVAVALFGAALFAVSLAGCTTALPHGTSSGASSSGAAGLSGVGELPAPASAWPAAQYDARHSSATIAIGPSSGSIRWQTKLGGSIVPGPVIGIDGDILAASNDGVLSDLDPADGSVNWTFAAGSSYGSDLSTSPAILGDGTILWPGPANTLYVVSTAGKKTGTISFDGAPLSPAIAGHDRVYVSDQSGRLTALSVAGGSVTKAWTVKLGSSSYASASVGPDGTIYAADELHLYAVRDLGNSAVVRWSFETKKPIEVSSAVAPDGTIILGTNHDKEYGVTPDGTVKWAIDIGDYTYSSSTATPAGLAYFADNTGRVRTVQASSGKVLQLLRPLGPSAKEHAWTSIAVDAAGNQYWGTEKGNVYGYSATGAQLFALNAGSGVTSYPALGAAGTLYVGTHDGMLLAIGGGGSR